MSKQWNLNPTPMRQGSARQRVIPAGPAQLGQRQGNHRMGGGETGAGGGRLDYQGVPIFGGTGGPASELGNAKAESTVCGPGGSRTVYKSGSQARQAEPHSESAEARYYTGARAMRNDNDD
jgi:hypothetical protein